MTTVFPAFRTSGPERTIALLTALGFTERTVVRDEADPTVVSHAEFAHGDSGAVMFGSVRDDGSDLVGRLGGMSCYVVTESDRAVDEIFERVVALGAVAVREPNAPEYGGREASVRDHDGNLWSFGSYPGA